MTAPPADMTTRILDPILRPRSIAVVGIGSKPGSMAERTLLNIVSFGFKGLLYGVARGRAEVAGVPCVSSIRDLPADIDTAVLSVPRVGLEAALLDCIERRVKSLVIFSAGFAEESDQGRADQERIAELCERNGVILAGPNCLGLINYVDGVPLCFGPLEPKPVAGRRAAAIISQSGAMMASTMLALHGRDLAVSYAVSTGNEAGLSIVDYVAALVSDPSVDVLCIFAEQLQRADEFIQALRTADVAGKRVVLLHPGRSSGAREAALSHTGTLAGDYDVMEAVLAYENIQHVETLEEFIDVAELLLRCPDLDEGGLAIVTDSGAAKGLLLDYCDKLGVGLATFSDVTREKLQAILPSFAVPTNPVDSTAAVLRDEAMLGNLAAAIMADEGVSSVLVTTMPDPFDYPLGKAQMTANALTSPTKASVYSVIGGETPINPGVQDLTWRAGVAFTRSPERSVRALAKAQRSKRTYSCGFERIGSISVDRAQLAVEAGAKAVIAQLGVRVPRGGMTSTVDEALHVAKSIGFPVVLKVQSADILHKTEVGGVEISIADEAGLRAAWAKMNDDVRRARPEAVVQGFLVEKMERPGTEFVLGAKRDKDWGTVIMVGLGGIWLEVMKDRRLFPADAGREAVRAELNQLRAAPLIQGHRGKPALDVEAIIDTIATVSSLMACNPELTEFEVNPLVVYPDGEGVLALDALAIY